MRSKSASKRVVIAAVIGNGLIAITKIIAAIITGSSAMLSESVHSVVDTSNQGLLLWGMKRAARPADKRHPFGYGMELYFWAFVVAILIFAIGAGVSLYEGFNKLRNPQEIQHIYINYIVLGFAVVFEGFAWIIALKEFRRRKGKQGYLRAVRTSKDPTVITVLFEDSAAVLGLITAFIGLLLAQYYANPVFDAVASIVIGIILSGTAMVLAYESKGLLIGESAGNNVVANIHGILANEKNILVINEVLTMHMSPDDILLNISIDFYDHISAREVKGAITRLERDIKKTHPEIVRIFIEAQNWTAHLVDKQNNQP